MIRDYTDEPVSNAKFTTDKLYPLIRDAYGQVVDDVNATADNPLIVTFTMSITDGDQYAMLPANVGQIVRIGEFDSTTGGWLSSWIPGGRRWSWGSGLSLEGSMLRFDPYAVSSGNLTVQYIPKGEFLVHVGTCTAANASSTTLKLNSAPTDGYFDARPNAYIGSILRVLSMTGTQQIGSTACTVFPVQERPIQSVAVTNLVATVAKEFDGDLSLATGSTYTYEVVPWFSYEIISAVAWHCAMSLHMIHGGDQVRAGRAAGARQMYNNAMRSLRGRVSGMNQVSSPLYRGLPWGEIQ